jgi:hypothetical protein
VPTEVGIKNPRTQIGNAVASHHVDGRENQQASTAEIPLGAKKDGPKWPKKAPANLVGLRQSVSTTPKGKPIIESFGVIVRLD